MVSFMTEFSLGFFPVERELTILLIALLIDGTTRLLLSNFRDRIAPLGGLVASVTGFVANKLNRDYRAQKILFFRGCLALVLLLGLSYGAALLISRLVEFHPRGQILSVLVIFSCLGVTKPWNLAPELIRLLRQKNSVMADIRSVLKRRQVRIDPSYKNFDQYAAARIIIEIIAQSFDRGLMRVAFWYCVPALFGYNGLVTAIMATAISEMAQITFLSEKNSSFSIPFQTLDDIVHFIPARLSAILLGIGMIFSPKMNPFKAIHCLLDQAHHHKSLNAGWGAAIMAGGLGVALASGLSKHKWIGFKSSSAKVGWQNIRHALTFHYITFVLALLILSTSLFLSLAV